MPSLRVLHGIVLDLLSCSICVLFKLTAVCMQGRPTCRKAGLRARHELRKRWRLQQQPELQQQKLVQQPQ